VAYAGGDPFHREIKDQVGEFPAHAAAVIHDAIGGQWYASGAGWQRGVRWLALNRDPPAQPGATE
jgi:uncharacterized membrane protein